MSRAPLQATLDEHVNYGAVAAYADGLGASAGQIQGYSWPDEPNAEHQAVIDALLRAAQMVRDANRAAHLARIAADVIHYGRIYGENTERLREAIAGFRTDQERQTA